MGAGTAAAPDVIEKLKASNATRLVAFFTNGETKPLALPEVRNKWLRTRALLANVGPWVKLEGYDKSGALLCVIENPEAAELEDLEPDFASDDARQVAPLLGLMLRAQDTVLHRFQAQQKHLLDAHLELLRLVSQRLMASEKAHQDALERAQSYAEALAEVLAKAGGDDDNMGSIIEALPAIAKLGGLLRGGVEKNPGQKSASDEKATNGK